MSPTAAERLAEARRELTDARREVLRARAAVLVTTAQLRELSRAHAPDAPEVAAVAGDLADRRDSLEDAVGREQQLRDAADAALALLLEASPSEVDTLSAAFPIVLLPVRLETRFATDAGGAMVLKVRVYPDEIMADTHEPPLTADERAAGEQFWRDGWASGSEREAWRALVTEYPSPRAAWIAKVLTPSNVTERPAGAPVFPAIEVRPESWSRGAEARVLPDRWVAVAYKNRVEAARHVGSPIQHPLVLSLAPITDDEIDASTIEIGSDGLRLDADVAWTVNFDRAAAAGMAMTIPLDGNLASGIDRLIVVGVKASLAPEAAGAELAALLDGHHYGAGFAFVRQGTPTNNTPAAPSPFPVVDTDGTVSFAVERGEATSTSDDNGAVFTRALGLPAALTTHVEGSGLREQPAARAMNEAVWPATWRYFLSQLMDPVAPDAAVRAAHTQFVQHVRGRGPLPAFRIGASPYGVLPVTALARWTTADAGVEAELPPLLLQLRRIWKEQARNVPRVGATADADADLLGVLGLDASAREVRARPLLGPQLQSGLFAALDLDAAHWQTTLRAIMDDVLMAVGHPEWTPRLATMTFADTAHRIRGPFVAPAPLSETAPIQPFNYIAWIRTASVEDLREEHFPPDASRPSALLYYLLRHAALVLYSEIATRVAIKHNVATRAELREAEAPGTGSGGSSRFTVWERLERPIPNVTGQLPLSRFILGDRGADTREIRVFHASLAQLEALPTAELDRLFTETLDTCSHRLDAWITSLASKRLEDLRRQQPSGSHLGAFGWVEDLRPDEGRPGLEPAALGGFIHAPSASHAATAAVLRNAYLAHAGEAQDRYAIDLSSTRVRGALQLLDAVRQGQPLGAVLGYRFERGLHEGHRPLRLEKYIDPFRRLFPLVADKGGESGEAVDAIAARNVVDGLLLRSAARAGTIPWGQRGLPAGGDDRAAIEAELLSLDRAVDGVADLLTAESVFQVVRANTDRAASVLDAVGQGLRPPEPEVVLQPRTGTAAAHRVAVVLQGHADGADGWASITATPRAAAEPALDRWVGALFGAPASIQCRVRHRDGAGQLVTRSVTAADLRLRPLDLLALATTLDADADAELDARIGATVPVGITEVEILYAADQAWDRSTIRTFPDVLELARAVNAMLATSRALEPGDLLPAEEAQAADAAERLTTDAAQRADAAAAALDLVKTRLATLLQGPDLDTAAAQAVLRDAARFGLRGAFTASRHAGEALLAAATRVGAELALRSAAAAAATTPTDRARAVFGRDFMFLTRFRPVNATELNLAVAHGPAAVGDGRRVEQWMQQLARVRPNLAGWRQVTLLAGVLGHRGSPVSIAQVPHAAPARWIGLPFASEADRPPSGRLSLALHRPFAAAADAPWAGLLIDAWTEIIPRPVEDTAIAFHYDDPGAEAPQAVLVAVPPTQAATWDLDTLVDTLAETLDLAKMRGVDADLLPLGQLLPAIHLAANPLRDTVSTDLRHLLQRSEIPG